MFLAMCADTGMLIGILFFMLLLFVISCALMVAALIVVGRWLEARRERRAEEAPSAAGA